VSVRSERFVFLALVCVLCLLVGGVVQAATVGQRAAAAVAVARARLNLANRQPNLEQRGSSGRMGLETPFQAVPAQSIPASSPVTEPVPQATVPPVVIEPVPVPIDLESIANAEPVSVPRRSPVMGPTLRPMRLVIESSASRSNGPAAQSRELPAQLVVKTWPADRNGQPTCPAGERVKAELLAKLKPLGWKMGREPDCQIRFVDGNPQIDSCPTIVLLRRGVESQLWERYTSSEILSSALRTTWDEEVERPAVMNAHGAAGFIEAGEQIRRFQEFLRTYIGDGVEAHVFWDRSGEQSLPLLARTDWTVPAFLGSRGHVSLEAKGAVKLPVDSLAFGYALRGQGVELDLEKIFFPDVLKNLKFSEDSPASAQPYGLFVIDDIVAYWGIYSAFSGIAALLSPHLDLLLPGQVSCSMVLNSDVITVDFEQAPTVKLVELFTFNLVVKRVVITDRNIHVQFSGSRLIQSRDFAVQ